VQEVGNLDFISPVNMRVSFRHSTLKVHRRSTGLRYLGKPLQQRLKDAQPMQGGSSVRNGSIAIGVDDYDFWVLLISPSALPLRVIVDPHDTGSGLRGQATLGLSIHLHNAFLGLSHSELE